MGACVFVADSRGKFDPIKTLRLLEKYPITTWCAPPTALRLIVREDLAQFDFPKLRHGEKEHRGQYGDDFRRTEGKERIDDEGEEEKKRDERGEDDREDPSDGMAVEEPGQPQSHQDGPGHRPAQLEPGNRAGAPS